MGVNDQPDFTSVVARPQTQLAGSPWTPAAGTVTKTFTLAADTSLIGILIPNFFNITNLQVKGHTSGFTYLNEDPFHTSFHPYYHTVIESAVDSQVDITVASGSSNTVYVSSIPDPVASIALPAQAAPWQAPNMTPLKVDFANPGQNNTVTIIAAQPNSESIWLHTMEWMWDAAPAGASGIWQDDSGTEIGADAALIAGAARFMDWRGAKMAGGKAFQYKQLGTAAAGTYNCRGTIAYAVY